MFEAIFVFALFLGIEGRAGQEYSCGLEHCCFLGFTRPRFLGLGVLVMTKTKPPYLPVFPQHVMALFVWYLLLGSESFDYLGGDYCSQWALAFLLLWMAQTHL